MLFNTGFSTFFTQDTRIAIKGEGGRALIRIAQELREATSVTSAQQTSLSTTVDTDDNGVDEAVQYAWSGTPATPLNRTSGGATTPLVDSVSGLVFSYYDSSNTQLSFPVSASQVRGVGIDLTVSDDDETFRLRSRARLRNL
jgi:hypothetical protein